jgi:hypothetical protein
MQEDSTTQNNAVKCQKFMEFQEDIEEKTQTNITLE